MYAFVKEKTVYVYENTERLRIRPRNSDSKLKQAVKKLEDKENQANLEQSNDKNTQNPKKNIHSPYGRQFYYEENHSMA